MKTGVHHPSVVVILRIVPCDYCLKVSCKHYMPLLTTVDLFVKQRYQLTSIHNPHLQMGIKWLSICCYTREYKL